MSASGSIRGGPPGQPLGPADATTLRRPQLQVMGIYCLGSVVPREEYRLLCPLLVAVKVSVGRRGRCCCPAAARDISHIEARGSPL